MKREKSGRLRKKKGEGGEREEGKEGDRPLSLRGRGSTMHAARGCNAMDLSGFDGWVG